MKLCYHGLMIKLSGFDPLRFLNITNLKNEEKDTTSKKLLNKISQYLFIRIVESLQKENIKKLNNPEDIFLMAKEKIPDLNNKIKVFLEEFKRKFYKNIRV